MNKRVFFNFFAIGGVFLLLLLGIYVGFKFTTNDKIVEDKTSTADDSIEKDETTPVITKTYDIEVVYKDEYTKCGHTIQSKDMVYGTTLENLKKEENQKQKEKGIIYEIEEESNDQIVYSRKVDQNCPNHFLVKIEKNDIVIYNIIDDAAMSVYKKLEVDINTLNPEMLEELNEGIKVDSKEDLNLIIEDIESWFDKCSKMLYNIKSKNFIPYFNKEGE